MRTLYLVVSGAPTVEPLEDLVGRAQGAGWDVWAISTPSGLAFHEDVLVKATGHPVRSRYRMPGEESNGLPAPDAVLAVPLTFATVNRWALGIPDNVAVSMLCELPGKDVPTVAVPICGPGLAAHPQFEQSLDVLAEMNVRVLFDPEEPPAWTDVLEALESWPGAST